MNAPYKYRRDQMALKYRRRVINELRYRGGKLSNRYNAPVVPGWDQAVEAVVALMLAADDPNGLLSTAVGVHDGLLGDASDVDDDDGWG